MKDAVGGEVKLAYTHNESDKAYKLLEAIPDINPDKPREAARETKPEYPEPRNYFDAFAQAIKEGCC